MLLTMFLPWYSQTATAVVTAKAGLASTTASFSAFGAFSWVEAAVLLVSAGVIAMLYARGRGHDFRLPGSDGLIVAIGGGWSALLIFYRMVDKPGVHGTARITATVGVEWGIFFSFACAVAMIAAGSRMRAGHMQGPPTMRERPVAGANDEGGVEGWANAPADEPGGARRHNRRHPPTPARRPAPYEPSEITTAYREHEE